MPARDGGGASLTFDNFTATILEVDEGPIETDVIDTTHLQTLTHETAIPSRLFGARRVEVKAEYDPGYRPAVGSTGTLAITFPGPPVQTDSYDAVLEGFEVIGVSQGDKIISAVDFLLIPAAALPPPPPPIGLPLAIISGVNNGESFATYDGTTWVGDDFWKGREWYYSPMLGKWIGTLITSPFTASVYNHDRTVASTVNLPDSTYFFSDEGSGVLLAYPTGSTPAIFTWTGSGSLVSLGSPFILSKFGVMIYNGYAITSGDLGTNTGGIWTCPLGSTTWTRRATTDPQAMNSIARMTDGVIANQWTSNRLANVSTWISTGPSASVLSTYPSPAYNGAGANAFFNSLVYAGSDGVLTAVAFAPYETTIYRRMYRTSNGGVTWTFVMDMVGEFTTWPRWNSRLGKFLGALRITSATIEWQTSPDGLTWTVARAFVTGQHGSRSAGG